MYIYKNEENMEKPPTSIPSYLKDKEGIKILEVNDPHFSRKIHGRKITRLRIKYSKKKLFEIVEIKNGHMYYLIDNGITGTKIFIRDDKGRLGELVDQLIMEFEIALSVKFDREIFYLDIYDGDIIFADGAEFFIEIGGDEEEYEQKRSKFKFKGTMIPFRVDVGVETGRIFIYINVVYFINELMNKIEREYKLN